mmetsp:Transcript_43621/g.64755  ORF Transcript_43621/g.64755 Transcript_43621/m.64755 type:complete len:80 (+) Transcript_43621:651-890(+)
MQSIVTPALLTNPPLEMPVPILGSPRDSSAFAPTAPLIVVTEHYGALPIVIVRLSLGFVTTMNALKQVAVAQKLWLPLE